MKLLPFDSNLGQSETNLAFMSRVTQIGVHKALKREAAHNDPLHTEDTCRLIGLKLVNWPDLVWGYYSQSGLISVGLDCRSLGRGLCRNCQR